MEDEIYSIGVDIGTTTTQVIFSKFKIKNTAGSIFIPKVEVTEKEVLYESNIYSTPYYDRNTIDINELKVIIDDEFINSDILKEEILIGTIIITGEAARKENSKEVIHELSGYAGEFVVSTAGTDIEAMFSGYGSGAYNLSKSFNARVLNFDIGGGTTNVAVFNSGELEDVFALDIGGRLISFDEEGKVEYISSKVLFLIKKLNLNITIGEKPSIKDLTKLCYRFSTMLVELIGLNKIKMDTLKLFIEHKNKKLPIDYITFSGGVAEYVYKDEMEIDESLIMLYKDIGPMLGICIKNTFKNYESKLLRAEEKIRATVKGAGNYSFVLSGSTVGIDEEVLPMKNIPIVRAFQFETENIELLYENVKNKLKLYGNSPIALAIKGPKSPTYEEIKIISSEVIKIFSSREFPIIVVLENDFAKALSQSLKLNISEHREVICIDNVSTNNGDYIDIGKPIGEVLPISVKTLVFSS